MNVFQVSTSTSFAAPLLSTPREETQRSPVWHGMLSTAVCFLVGAMSKVVIGLNHFEIYHQQKLVAAIEEAKQHGGKGVLTICNHTSMLDDPVGIVASVPFSHVVDTNRLRWTLGAQDMLFGNKLMGHFFTLGQVISTIRGGGLNQPALGKASQKLDEGKWVHIFPEGKISQTTELLPMRRGVGKIIAGAEEMPIITPIYFHGMRALVCGFPVGNQISVIIGDPVDVSALLEPIHGRDTEPTEEEWNEVYQQIADKLGESLQKLSTELDALKE